MYDQLLENIEQFLAQKPNRTEGLTFICELLERKVEKYSWVGYYLHSKEKPELVLATYQGANYGASGEAYSEFAKGGQPSFFTRFTTPFTGVYKPNPKTNGSSNF